jgi:flagellin FlaB
VVEVGELNREKPNIKCPKCDYQWHTRSVLHMVSCPSCNQKIRNSVRSQLMKIIQQKRAIVGLETAIILIAFVIIAAAFSFMVVNQGLFATDRGKTVISQGLSQAGTPLIVDGTIFVRTTPDGTAVNYAVVPIKAFGSNFVNMGRNQTSVILRVGDKAWANAYLGVLHVGNSDGSGYIASSAVYDPTGKQFDDFVGFQMANETGMLNRIYVNETYGAGYAKGLTTGVVFTVSNSNGDEALNSGEEGYLLIALGPDAQALARAQVSLELRIENSATISIVFQVPASMPANSYVAVC